MAGPVNVSWHRSRITVKPKEGWKRRVYRLEILPGFTDLRHNRSDSAKTVLFTTGPEIGHARIGGIVLKWIEQTIMVRALIEAVPLPDSVGYLTLADSGGQFNLQNLAPGRYIVYATSDDNNDRRRSPREAYDSTLVTLDSSSNVALFAFPHDTLPPRPRTATFIDSITVRAEFSQALDPSAATPRLDAGRRRPAAHATPVRFAHQDDPAESGVSRCGGDQARHGRGAQHSSDRATWTTTGSEACPGAPPAAAAPASPPAATVSSWPWSGARRRAGAAATGGHGTGPEAPRATSHSVG